MRIACPYCGERDHSEFTYRGDAAPKRPPLRNPGPVDAAPAPPDAAMTDYVYIRENPAGPMQELWQHVGGCRAWVVATRDVTSHQVRQVEAARAVPGREANR